MYTDHHLHTMMTYQYTSHMWILSSKNMTKWLDVILLHVQASVLLHTQQVSFYKVGRKSLHNHPQLPLYIVLKDQASCLLSASPSIHVPATIHIHTYSSYTTKYKCQAHHKSTCMHHMKSAEPCSYLMTTQRLQCPFYLSCC